LGFDHLAAVLLTFAMVFLRLEMGGSGYDRSNHQCNLMRPVRAVNHSDR
jgi:hypothetical protein